MRSMTGFGRGDSECDELSLSIEMKSVNHKYIDFQIKMPSYLYFMEDTIKKWMKECLSRGRIEVYLRSVRKFSGNSRIDVDINRANAIKNSLVALNNYLEFQGVVDLNHILQFEGVVNQQLQEIDEEMIQLTVEKALSQALTELCIMREKEGENLKLDLKELVQKMMVTIQCVEERAPYLADEYRKRLMEKISRMLDSNPLLSEDRIELEVLLYAERSDIHEEIVRLKSHLHQFLNVMEATGAIGKKLDFITQEMNREVNTIGSKSSDAGLTSHVIEMKSLIDKIREQVQNIE